MFETIVIDVDDECVPRPKKAKNVVVELTTNFRRSRL
jgi:hypothetical protein